MTIFYPDVASGQTGISFSGVPIAMVKATEGTSYINPDYVPAKLRAKEAGAFFCAYHFLQAGNGAGQADHAYSVVGSTPLMLDMETETLNGFTSKPSVTDAANFVSRYRAHGGVIYLLYLPRWYWASLGSPSLTPLIELGLLLVSSNYTSYSDSGPGWASYGGMTPVIWQYTDNETLNRVNPVDFNACTGGPWRNSRARSRPAPSRAASPCCRKGTPERRSRRSRRGLTPGARRWPWTAVSGRPRSRPSRPSRPLTTCPWMASWGP